MTTVLVPTPAFTTGNVDFSQIRRFEVTGDFQSDNRAHLMIDQIAAIPPATFANAGILVDGGAKITSTGTGANAAAITLTVTGGSGSTSDDGVRFATGSKISTVDGAINVIGTAGADSSGVSFSSEPGGSPEGIASTGTGAITLVADSMSLDQGRITAGTNLVTLKQKTNGVAINLGGNDGPGTLGLNTTELANITAGTLAIGDANSGAITVSTAIDVSAKVGTLELRTGANVIDGNAFGADLAVSKLLLVANTGVASATNSLDTAVANLEAQTNTGVVFVSNTGNVALGGVSGSMTGIHVTTSGDVNISSTGSIELPELLSTPNTVMLSSGSAITTNDTNLDVQASSLVIGANAGIGDFFPIRTNVDVLRVTALGGGNVQIFESNSVDLTGVSVTGRFTLRASGAITDSGNISVMNVASFISLSSSITLGDEANETTDFRELHFSGGAVSISEDSSTRLTGPSRASSLMLVGAGITNTPFARLDVQGSASFVAGDNDVTLGTQSDDRITFGSFAAVGRNVTLFEDDATALDLVEGAVIRLDSTGTITDNNGTATNLVATTGAALSASGGIGAGDTLEISVANVAASNTTSGAIELASVAGMNLGSVGPVVGISNPGRDVRLTAGGAVTQSAGAAITSAGLVFLGAGPFTLEDAGNDATVLAANTTGTIFYRDANTLSIGTSGVTNGITTTNADVTVCLVTGNLSVDQPITVGTGTVRLQTLDGRIVGAGAITASALGLRAQGGGISLTSPTTNVNTLAASTTAGFSFQEADGFAFGTVGALGCFTTDVVGLTVNGDVELCVQNGDLSIASPINVGANTLRLYAATGSVNQSGTGTISALNLAATAGQAVILTLANAVTSNFAA